MKSDLQPQIDKPQLDVRNTANVNKAYSAALWYNGLCRTNNEAFMPLFFDKHRYLVLKGGGGSGKSVFAARKVLERATSEGGHRFLVCRKVGRTLRESCFRLIMAQLDMYYPDVKPKINQTELRISFPNGSEIIFAGLDNPDKLKSIYEITDIWIEEAAELDESDFNQLDIRMRGASKYYRQMMISFNPVSVLHWLKRRFFDADDKVTRSRTRVHESTYLDNRWLTEEDRETLEAFRETDEYYYTVYCLGQWGIVGTTVFDAQGLTKRLSVLPKPVKVGAFEFVWENERISEGSYSFVSANKVGCNDGYIKIYKDVEAGVPYVIGADTAGDGSDSFVAQVLDNRTGEQVAVLRQKMDEDLFVRQLYCLGRYYNDALIGVEINFSTYPVRELQRLRYPKLFVRDVVDSFTHEATRQFGFRTDTKTRPVIIAELVKVVREHVELINDYTTVSEMLTFIRDPKTFKPTAAEGAHDDTVMALAIAHYLRPFQSCIVETEVEGRVTWHESQWEDYYNASEAEREVLLKRWGVPKK
ncbi:MAG: PBSX family phage terminase large subunit [Clostridiales bacterium]|nr:PBSX family phage terminase large subunit [Clostridiales bacterium]